MEYNYFSSGFNNKVEISKENRPFGTITFNSWKSTVIAQMNQRNFEFKKKSFWSSNYDLFENERIIATITFKSFSDKTIIFLEEKGEFQLKRVDFWGKKWEIINERGEKITLEKRSNFWNQKGSIYSESNNSDSTDLLALIATFILFVKSRRAAAAAAS